MNDSKFYEAIGYLSARDVLIEVEVASKKATQFESDYLAITGDLIKGSQEYYIIENKWAAELRLYLSNVTNAPDQIKALLRSDNYRGYKARINNNDLVMRMFRHGFRVGSYQNPSLISASIPASHNKSFLNGKNL